jgi:hypothetical protein
MIERILARRQFTASRVEANARQYPGLPQTFPSVRVAVGRVGTSYSYAVIASDPDGGTLAYSLDTAPAGMAIDAAGGLIAWVPASAQVGSHAVSVRATDAGGLFAVQSFSVAVAAPNTAPTAADDAWSTMSGATLDVAAPGVLGNDSDADSDPLTAVLASAPASGSLTLDAGGGFSYTPDAGFSGSDSFAYRAFDGVLHGNLATVSITVAANSPPVARDDSASAPLRKTTSYTPRVIDVLANDTDAEGAPDPASVSIAAAPNKGGTVTVNASGTVSYTPRLKFRGKETFKYTVRDQAGELSNDATVTVNVK